MTSKTELALVALATLLQTVATANPSVLVAPLRNEALPARLAEAGASGLQFHLNQWDGDTTIDQEMLGADVIDDGYELSHDASVEYVVAGGAAADREAAFDAGVKAILAGIKTDRTLGDVVDDCRVIAIRSSQRELVTDGLPNAKGAELVVRFTFNDSDIR